MFFHDFRGFRGFQKSAPLAGFLNPPKGHRRRRGAFGCPRGSGEVAQPTSAGPAGG